MILAGRFVTSRGGTEAFSLAHTRVILGIEHVVQFEDGFVTPCDLLEVVHSPVFDAFQNLILFFVVFRIFLVVEASGMPFVQVTVSYTFVW